MKKIKPPVVMLLAAGRGERLRPLTDTTPKALININGETTLIETHLKRLKKLELTEIVINVAWLGQKIISHLGDGSQYGVNIRYSDESNSALETAGGIINALELLGSQPFIVINSDIYTDFDFRQLQLKQNKLAQLVLVPNPDFHPQGDFFILNNECHPSEGDKFTFSGIAMYHPDFFKGITVKVLALGPILQAAIAESQVNATLYNGLWFDIGTPERLTEIQKQLQKS